MIMGITTKHLFTQNLSALVLNAKLDRPLDSNAPQTEQASEQQSDGDERMVKDGEDISKFS